MGFVNDYATDEEVERYKLKALWDQFNPRLKGRCWVGRKLDFTIDRSRGAFLMFLSDGSGEQSNWRYILFFWKGTAIPLTVMVTDNSSLSLRERPFTIEYAPIEVSVPDSLESQKENVISDLKDALVVYGYSGVQRQVPETDVKFRF